MKLLLSRLLQTDCDKTAYCKEWDLMLYHINTNIIDMQGQNAIRRQGRKNLILRFAVVKHRMTLSPQRSIQQNHHWPSASKRMNWGKRGHFPSFHNQNQWWWWYWKLEEGNLKTLSDIGIEMKDISMRSRHWTRGRWWYRSAIPHL